MTKTIACPAAWQSNCGRQLAWKLVARVGHERERFGVDRRWLSVLQHDQSNQHDHDGAFDHSAKEAEFTSRPERCHRWNTDTQLCLPARDTSCAFDGRDQGSHQRGTVHEDAEGCHTDQRCAPREGARSQRHLRFSTGEETSVTSPMCQRVTTLTWFSARDQTSVTSPMRHARVPRKSRRSPATGS